MLCTVPGCKNTQRNRGLCGGHYNKLRKSGELPLITRSPVKRGEPCSVSCCPKEARYKGLCTTHYKREWRHGDPEKTLINVSGAKCLIDDCEEVGNKGQGLCNKHYQRMKANGHTDLTRRERGTGAINAAGYVLITVDGVRKYEHIHVAEKALGKPLPLSAVVHHLDGNPANNSPTNLVICPDQAYHMLLHKRERDIKMLRSLGL